MPETRETRLAVLRHRINNMPKIYTMDINGGMPAALRQLAEQHNNNVEFMMELHAIVVKLFEEEVRND